jgi:ACS family tartrate transporter-like MFS transporter
MDNFAGLHGWQWLYIIEGVPAVIAGLLTPILLTDKPEDAKWLNSEEKSWLLETISAEQQGKSLKNTSHPFLGALKDRRVYIYAVLLFCVTLGN